jgi:Uma2 family endonuclease
MVQTELTLDDLEQMPDDGMHRELVNGELIELPPPERRHSEEAHNIYDCLSPFVKHRRLGRMFVEAGYKVTSDKRNWIQPDVSFVRLERLDQTDRFFVGAPDFAVEVISPSERPKHFLAKRAVLFEAGCREIWVVRSKTRRIEVWTPRGMDRELRVGDTLSSPLFEGWSMPVADVFA